MFSPQSHRPSRHFRGPASLRRLCGYSAGLESNPASGCCVMKQVHAVTGHPSLTAGGPAQSFVSFPLWLLTFSPQALFICATTLFWSRPVTPSPLDGIGFRGSRACFETVDLTAATLLSLRLAMTQSQSGPRVGLDPATHDTIATCYRVTAGWLSYLGPGPSAPPLCCGRAL